MFQVSHNQEGHQFYMEQDGILIAEMTYSITRETLYIIDHTFVNENYRGQGLAEQLMSAVVQFARDHQIKLIPLCPFAKKQFETKPEYADVRY
ncbi:GNAT family N-acetyltransferase [Paenibacillus aquistagni]|uniref:GNAT family N-acetyltransferase n=1 Tax=Paenibacillus aquistagni TaxID=1852522 RepID=UPI00145B0071|nr:GNAT family N-acetyltransferase [Paenibacillus aquistagni]NMM54407.1 N-acetyltransferase [Paenibacillus aquistagni]